MWTNISTPAIGTPTKQQSFARLVVQNLSHLYNQLLGVTGSREMIVNGSFESDVDSDGVPDGWSQSLFNGGSFLHDASTLAADDKASHGRRSAKFTSPGGATNGGGTLVSTDFFEVSAGRAYFMTWQHKSSVAGIHNLVDITFYDSTQASISVTNLYDSASNPTAWTIGTASFTPPANARYAKVTLTGAKNDNTTAGSAWFDDVRIHLGPKPTMVVYTANDTWVCPAGIYRIRVRCWGGGGGGGTTGGGGGGGYGEGIFDVVPGTSYAVVVGAGGASGSGAAAGTSSLGSLISASGGSGLGGAGGTSAAMSNMTGGTGGDANGEGGDAGGPGGSGGRGGNTPTSGTEPGGGGGSRNAGGGGAGAKGRVIVEYLT